MSPALRTAAALAISTLELNIRPNAVSLDDWCLDWIFLTERRLWQHLGGRIRSSCNNGLQYGLYWQFH
jgi:hypothetical protein